VSNTLRGRRNPSVVQPFFYAPARNRTRARGLGNEPISRSNALSYAVSLLMRASLRASRDERQSPGVGFSFGHAYRPTDRPTFNRPLDKGVAELLNFRLARAGSTRLTLGLWLAAINAGTAARPFRLTTSPGTRSGAGARAAGVAEGASTCALSASTSAPSASKRTSEGTRSSWSLPCSRLRPSFCSSYCVRPVDTSGLGGGKASAGVQLAARLIRSQG